MRRQLGRAEQCGLSARWHGDDHERHSSGTKLVRDVADSQIEVRETLLPNWSEGLPKIVGLIPVHHVCADKGFSVLKNEVLSH